MPRARQNHYESIFPRRRNIQFIRLPGLLLVSWDHNCLTIFFDLYYCGKEDLTESAFSLFYPCSLAYYYAGVSAILSYISINYSFGKYGAQCGIMKS